MNCLLVLYSEESNNQKKLTLSSPISSSFASDRSGFLFSERRRLLASSAN